MNARGLLVVAACVAACGRPATRAAGDAKADSASAVVDAWPFACGDATCRGDQLCATITAGHTCDTNDAGIGEYDVLGQYCMDVPASCNGTPSCGCITGCVIPSNGETRPCLSTQAQAVSCGCY